MFPVRYELNFYINLLRNLVFKEFIYLPLLVSEGHSLRALQSTFDHMREGTQPKLT
jgi:hypothetical protein